MSDNQNHQNYFLLLEKKLDQYYLALLNKEPAEEFNAELKGFLEAGMVLQVTSKDVLQQIISNRYKSILG